MTRSQIEMLGRLEHEILERGGKIPSREPWEDMMCYLNTLLETVENLRAIR